MGYGLSLCSPDDELFGLYMDENYYHEASPLAWGANIRFSWCERGDAICAHFSANRKGLRDIKTAIDCFLSYAFEVLGAPMVLATISRPSVARLVNKLGFFHVIDHEGLQVWGIDSWAT